MKRTPLFLALTLLFSTSALAAGSTWSTGTPYSNGAIILKSTNGTTTYSATQNPVGANVHINTNTLTQPPIIIIQNGAGGGAPTGATIPPTAVNINAGNATNPTNGSNNTFPTCGLSASYTVYVIAAGGGGRDFSGGGGGSGWLTNFHPACSNSPPQSKPYTIVIGSGGRGGRTGGDSSFSGYRAESPNSLITCLATGGLGGRNNMGESGFSSNCDPAPAGEITATGPTQSPGTQPFNQIYGGLAGYWNTSGSGSSGGVSRGNFGWGGGGMGEDATSSSGNVNPGGGGSGDGNQENGGGGGCFNKAISLTLGCHGVDAGSLPQNGQFIGGGGSAWNGGGTNGGNGAVFIYQ